MDKHTGALDRETLKKIIKKCYGPAVSTEEVSTLIDRLDLIPIHVYCSVVTHFQYRHEDEIMSGQLSTSIYLLLVYESPPLSSLQLDDMIDEALLTAVILGAQPGDDEEDDDEEPAPKSKKAKSAGKALKAAGKALTAAGKALKAAGKAPAKAATKKSKKVAKRPVKAKAVKAKAPAAKKSAKKSSK